MRFDGALHLGIERRPPDLHARRRAEPVEDPRLVFTSPIRDRLNEIKMLVTTTIAREPERGRARGHFLFCDRAGFFAALFVRVALLAARAGGLRLGAGAWLAARARDAAGAASRERCTSVKRI